MIITEILGNIHDEGVPEGMHMERVTLSEAQMVKRMQRVRSDHGQEIGIQLPHGAPDLQDGDILFRSDNNMIVVQMEPTDVLVIKPRSIVEMGVVAHSLGNRHLQAQFFDADSEYGTEVMVVLYDHTVEQYLDSVQAPYDRQDRVMPKPFRHSEHTH